MNLTVLLANVIQQPFPHCVIDDFIDRELVRAINSEWPSDPWENHHHGYAQKRGCKHWEAFGPKTFGIIRMLNSALMVDGLSGTFGFEQLSADDSLEGGGLHETFRGGFLGIHADFNIHPESRLLRRLNLLLFLNEDWLDSWGGDLELWDAAKTGCQVRIAPIAGRAVIFATSWSSFHGHPAPLACPEGRSRRSIALYYYSPELPEELRMPEHSTLYLGDEAKWPSHAR